MTWGNLFSATAIPASGLSAERQRMEVAANNLANAQTTRSLDGGAYRRQQVVFSTAFKESLTGTRQNAATPISSLQGVQVSGILPDASPLPRVLNPGHPDADADGFVEMPNVSLPVEMLDLMTASRAYEANLKSLQTFREMAEQSLSLMRSQS